MAQASLGEAVRRLREARGITLRSLAERAGFSAGFISQVENEQASPSIASMERIAAALGTTLGEFFDFMGRNSAGAAHRSEDHVVVHSDWSRAEIEAAGGERAGGRLHPVLVTLHPGGSSGKRPYPAPAEELVVVLEGCVVLTNADGERNLDQGDVVTIPAQGLRRWENRSARRARIVIVATP